MLTAGGRTDGDIRPRPWSAAESRSRVAGFARRTFLWPGTLKLHRAALGADVLRAPANVFLSPVLVLVRLAAWACLALRMPGPGAWLRGRRILLRTDVSARVEAAILRDLLGLSVPDAGPSPRDGGPVRAILAAPELQGVLEGRTGRDQARVTAERIGAAIEEYTGTRSAIAELTTALVTLTVGAAVFHALTPGMISMAPGVADALTRSAAVAAFPLGETLGGLWYGVFPARTAPWLVAAILAGLVAAGALVTAFAGILADPVQVWLGIHRRRLMRLIDTLEAELAGTGDRPFVAREHYVARALDLWDAALSVVRTFRG